MCGKDGPLWRLAERLYEAMDALDPSGIDWVDLSDSERDLFYSALKVVFLEGSDVLAVVEFESRQPRLDSSVMQFGKITVSPRRDRQDEVQQSAL